MNFKYKIVLCTIAIFSISQIFSEVILNENCSVNILNRTIQVNTDGSWQMPNVPSFMGRIKARATCLVDGETVSGESDYFTIEEDAVNLVEKIRFTDPQPVPTALTFTGGNETSVNLASNLLQLNVVASFKEKDDENVTASNGINFVSSNPNIADVNSTGLVSFNTAGSVLITTRLDGAVSIKRITISSGLDADNDGIPDGIEISNGLDPSDPIDAMEDQDRDGLSALEEFNLGTEINLADTDGDGLEDGEETTLGEDGFITNPLLVDTDGDGLSDGLEQLVSSDPTDATSRNLLAALDSLSVNPERLVLTFNSIDTEVSRELTVTGNLIDGSEIDLTSKSTGTSYVSDDLNIASFGLTDGEIFGGQPGATIVRITNNNFTVEVPVVVENFAAQGLSAIDIPGFAYNVDVAGDYAYVASEAGLIIVDVSDRSAPVIVSTFATPGNSEDVKVLGNTVFLADGDAGLQIIDVSDPVNPVLISTHDTAGYTQDLHVDFNYAYLANGDEGVEIVDISNYSSPFTVSSLRGLNTVKGIDVDNDLIVIAAERAVHIIDAQDITRPIVTSNISLTTLVDVSVSQGYAFVSASRSGYRVIDYRDINNPILVGSASDIQPSDIAINSGLAIATDRLFVNIIGLLNIQSPENTVFQGIVNLSQTASGRYYGTGIAVDNRYAYSTKYQSVGGGSKLFIAQYRDITDSDGIPPVVSINRPTAEDVLVESNRFFVDVEAQDDIGVDYVSVFVDGVEVGRSFSPPYQLPIVPPAGNQNYSLSVSATDFAGNVSELETVNLIVQFDSDSDQLGNNEEINTYFTNPNLADTDSDGLNDGREVSLGTNPLNSDSDSDGISDGDEVANQTDPLNPDVTVPTVVSLSPENLSVDVSETTEIRITFSEPMSIFSVEDTSLMVQEKSVSSEPVSGVLTLSDNSLELVFQPNSILKDLTEYEITLSSLKDRAGNPLMNFVSTFTTGDFVDTEKPRVISSNPTTLARDVSTNTIITVLFDEPVNIENAEIELNQSELIRLEDNSLSSIVEGEFKLLSDRQTLIFTSSNLLSSGQQHFLNIRNVSDLSGNVLDVTSVGFTTSFIADSTSPEVIGVSINDGLFGVPLNSEVQIGFNERVNNLSLLGINLYKNDELVELQSRMLDDSEQLVSLEFVDSLEPFTEYVLKISGVEDISGNSLLNPIESRFTTGDQTDFSSPIAPSSSFVPLQSSENVPLNASISLRFNERLNSLNALNILELGRVSLQRPIQNSDGATFNTTVEVELVLSDDGQILTVLPKEPLLPNTRYEFRGFNFHDLAGNVLFSNFFSFTTGQDTIETNLELTGQLINNGLVEVPRDLNAITFEFNHQISAICLNAGTVQLVDLTNGNVIENVQLSANGNSLTLSPDVTLSENTNYQITLDGICDLSGNTLSTPYSSTFTTGTILSDNVRPSIASRSPTFNESNVSVNAPIIITFTEPMRASDIKNLNVNTNGTRLAGSTSVSNDQRTFTFQPEVALPSDSLIFVTLVFDEFRDLSGNVLVTTFNDRFRTEENVSDNVRPEVIAIFPNDNSIDISTRSQVVLDFSESLDSSTINDNSFSLFANGERLTTQVSRSVDNDSVILAADLPANSVISVIATDSVRDLEGNQLSDFISLFTTGDDKFISNSNAQILTFKPGNGSTNVSPDTSIILYSSIPLNESTLQSGQSFYVTQNGQLINGTVTLSTGGRVIKFIPDIPFGLDSVVGVFVNSELQTLSGRSVSGFQGAFRVQKDLSLTSPKIVSSSGVQGLPFPVNSVYDLRFNESINPESVNVRFEKNNSSISIDNELEWRNDNKNLRILPVDDLLFADSPYLIVVTGSDNEGDTFQYVNELHVSETNEIDTVSPNVTLLSPISGTTDVPTNAKIAVVFDEAINSVSIDESSFVMDRAGSLTISSDNETFTYVPHEPLPENSQVNAIVDGVEDVAANPLETSVTSVFTTSNGISSGSISEIPNVTRVVPEQNALEFPINGLISIQIDQAIDLLNSTVTLVKESNGSIVSSTLKLSDNGHAIILTPDELLEVNTRYQYRYNLETLVGARVGLPSNTYVDFTTSSDFDITSPTVLGFNISDAETDVPLNAELKVVFSEPLNNQSFSGIEVFEGINSLSIEKFQLNSSQNVVTVKLNKFLEPNTEYRIVVNGVEDRSGNLLDESSELVFKTGASVDLQKPILTKLLPESVISINSSIVLEYNEKLSSLIELSNEAIIQLKESGSPEITPIDIKISTNRNALIIKPSESLLPNSTYNLIVNGIEDFVGNTLVSESITLTTNSLLDDVPPSILSTSIPNGFGQTPLNVELVFDLSEPVTQICNLESVIELIELTSAQVIEGKLFFTNDSKQLKFKPNQELSANSDYSFTIDGLCDFSDNLMPILQFNFSTDESKLDDLELTVVNTEPTDDGENVEINSTIVIQFNKPIQQTGIEKIELRNQNTNQFVPYVISVNTTQDVITLTPENPLSENAYYSFYIPTNTIFDLSGIELNGDYVYRFSTVGTETECIPTLGVTCEPSNDGEDI